MAGILNFVGALSGTAVATTVGKGIIEPGAVTQQLVISALLSAIVWDLLTWYYGIPSSSSHALVFSIVGAGIASGGLGVLGWVGIEKVLIGLVTSPVLGLAAGFIFMVALLNTFARDAPGRREPLLRAGAARLVDVHGVQPRQQRRPEDDGRHHDVARRRTTAGPATTGRSRSG